MEIYKKGQGKLVRGGTYASLLLLLLYGCYSLYDQCMGAVWGKTALFAVEDLGLKVTWALIVGIVVFLFFGWVIHWFLNKEKSAEYLIETEAEMKKVSWPARKEYMSASTVVLVLVIFISLFLYTVDSALEKILKTLGLGF